MVGNFTQPASISLSILITEFVHSISQENSL